MKIGLLTPQKCRESSKFGRVAMAGGGEVASQGRLQVRAILLHMKSGGGWSKWRKQVLPEGQFG